MANYIKDSNNFYTLYVDQGTDFSLTILSSSFNVVSIGSKEYNGSIAQHSTSKRKVEFLITKNTEANSITLYLSPESTSELKEPRYNFDIIQTDGSNKKKVINGTVVVRNTISGD